MRKELLIILLILFFFVLMLNIEVSTRQGKNYRVQTIKIPLYLKLLDFFDRHFNYRQLAKNITINTNSDKEKVMKIFYWVHQNIIKAPDGMPVVDDHVWSIIIRGYGANDQFCDVFTTLCDYAGINAFFSWVKTQDRDSFRPLSFVKINGRWNVFDPYSGVYFKNLKGDLASIEEMAQGDWVAVNEGSFNNDPVDYTLYTKGLQDIKRASLTKANIQSPVNRLRFQIKKWMRQI